MPAKAYRVVIEILSNVANVQSCLLFFPGSFEPDFLYIPFENLSFISKIKNYKIKNSFACIKAKVIVFYVHSLTNKREVKNVQFSKSIVEKDYHFFSDPV